MTKFNLDREFIKWFYEDNYTENQRNRWSVMSGTYNTRIDWTDYWMRLSFKAGAEAMWQDINGALLDWACAVEGLEPELLEPCEVYDRARENLHSYVYEQLELFND